jgi:hypothetical protein
MAVSFAKAVRPLFRDDPDVKAMKGFHLDLSSYDALKRGLMPSTGLSLTAACPATVPGPKNKSPSSKSGSTKACTIGKAAT